MNEITTINKPLDFDAFMQAIGFFSINEFVKDGYTNEDWLMQFVNKGDTMEIRNYNDYPDSEIIQDIPMPKTIIEAIDALPMMFNDADFTDDDNEILNEYKIITLFN